MKGIKGLVLLVISLVLVAGCSGKNNAIEVTLTDETKTVVEEKVEPVKEDVEEELDDSILDSPVANLLHDVMTTAMSTQNVFFTTSIDDTMYYIDQTDEVLENYVSYYDYLTGYIDRETEKAYVNKQRNYVHSEFDFGNPVSRYSDSHEYNEQNYVDKIYGIYSFYEQENEWYKTEVGEGFRTLEDLEDIVNLFLSHYESVTVEEITDSNDGDFGKTILKLDVTVEQFSDAIPRLTFNIFSGFFDYIDYFYEYQEFNHYYAGLIVDSDNNVTAYYVSYSTPIEGGSEEDYYSLFMRVDLFDHNMTEVPSIPEEAFANAVTIDYDIE